MYCYIHHQFVPYREASLHISDVGLQRGYAIFDFFLAFGQTIPFFDDYLDRFFRSAGLVDLKIPISRDQLIEIIRELLRRNGFEFSGIKLLLTGGPSEDLYQPGEPELMVINLPHHSNPMDQLSPVRLMLLEYQRHLPEVKTTNYFPTLARWNIMKSQGVHELLYHFQGRILECTRSNIFLVRNDRLITPSEDILHGIIRKNLIEALKETIPVEVRPVPMEDLISADEVFITGTSKHVLPVMAVDKFTYTCPGPITAKVSQIFREYFQQQLQC